MTDREQWGMRGPVRSCRLQRKWYSRRCGADSCRMEERGDTAALDFRPDGSLTRYWHKNPDGSEWNTTYEYDDAGRLVLMRVTNAAGVTNLRHYGYGNSGRLSRVLTRDENGERIVETYEYDPCGRKSKNFHVDVAAQRPDTHYGWGVEGTDAAYSAPGAASLTTLYNELDQPIALSFYDLAGCLLSRVEFRYDDAGHLIGESQTRSEETLPPETLESLNPAQRQAVRGLFGIGEDAIRRTHFYDAQGRRVETRSKIGPLEFDRKTVSYNEHGDPLIEMSEHEERDYTIDEEGRISDSSIRQSASRSEARFCYDYDSQGNWVSKTVEVRTSSEDEFTMSAVERRTITYFA